MKKQVYDGEIMKKKLPGYAALLTGGIAIVLGILLMPSTMHAEIKQAATPAPAAHKKGDTLAVVARLVEVAGKFPSNDLYNYVYVMKYRVISVEKGTSRGPELYVGHYNPLIARKQIKDKMDPLIDGTVSTFKPGDTHSMLLVTPIESVWKDAVEDEYADSEEPKFFALKCDLVNKK